MTVITFNANGAVGTPPDTRTVNGGSSIALPDGGWIEYSKFAFGGWNTNAEGTGQNRNAGSSFTTSSLFDSNITLYATWVVPRILAKDVEAGVVSISMRTENHNIPYGTTEFRLFRANSQNGVYSEITNARILASSIPLILQDNSVDWTTLGEHYYKVAAVTAEGIEILAISGVRLSKRAMQLFATGRTVPGFMGVRLNNHQWTAPSATRLTLLTPPPPGNYTLQTAWVISLGEPLWTWGRNELFKASHSHEINVTNNSVRRTFLSSSLTFFSP